MWSLLSDSLYFEEHWVFWVWADVVDYILVLSPWKFCAVSHCIDFWQYCHQGAVAYVALNLFPVEDDFVAYFAAEVACSFDTLNRYFNIEGKFRSSPTW